MLLGTCEPLHAVLVGGSRTRAYRRRMRTYKVPGVGRVSVTLHVHQFGLTSSSVTTLESVRFVDGGQVPCHAHERVAQHLETLGVIDAS